MRAFACAGWVCALFVAVSANAQIEPGALMVSEYDTGSIVDVSGGGNFAGTPRFATGLSGPTGLCFGPEGALYVAEFESGEVTVASFGGDLSSALPFATGLGGPMALHCDSESILVVEATDGSGEVTDITAGGDFTGAPAFAAGLGSPVDLGVDFEGRLWATDVAQGRVFDVTGGGVFLSTTPFATGGSGTRGLTGFGELSLVANQGTNQVIDFTLGGDLATLPVFATVPGVVALIQVPGLGLFAAADSENSVYEITPGGDFSGLVPFATGIAISNDFAGMAHLGGCGDGILDIEAEEDCDDGNNLDGDGCNAECQIRLCLNPPATSCIAAGSGSLSVTSKREGKEKIKVSLGKFDAEVSQSMLGEPIFGNSRYDVCFYDDDDELINSLRVDRAFDVCGPKEDTCWKVVGASGYRYKDVDTRSSGVKAIVAKGGKAGKGSIKVQAGNNAKKNQRRMPTNIDNRLSENNGATVQIMVSDGECFGVTVGTRKAEDDLYKGKK